MINFKLKAKIVETFGTQSDFAQKLGIDETIISRVIRGRRNLSDEEKQRWAEALKLKIADFGNN